MPLIAILGADGSLRWCSASSEARAIRISQIYAGGGSDAGRAAS